MPLFINCQAKVKKKSSKAKQTQEMNKNCIQMQIFPFYDITKSRGTSHNCVLTKTIQYKSLKFTGLTEIM